MDLWQVILLGIVQGITEWLPISSSGHLVFFQEVFKIKASMSFDVLLHFGSLIVILLVFWGDIIKFRKEWLYVILASIPIGFVGYFFRDFISGFFSSLFYVGLFFIVTGGVLLLSKRISGKNLNFKNTFLIGIAQAFALLPGISRSGFTVSSGLFLGVKRKDVAKFSFILAIPAILGASVLEAKNVVFDYYLLLGVLISVIVGYVSLKWLLKVIYRGQFWKFSFYCFLIGGLSLGLSLI